MLEISIKELVNCVKTNTKPNLNQIKSIDDIIVNETTELIEELRKKKNGRRQVSKKEIIDLGQERIYLPLLFYFSKQTEKCKHKFGQSYAVGCVVGYAQAISILWHMKIKRVCEIVKTKSVEDIVQALMFSAFFHYIDELKNIKIEDIEYNEDEVYESSEFVNFPYKVFNNTLEGMIEMDQQEQKMLIKTGYGFWLKLNNPTKRHSMDKKTLMEVIKMLFAYSEEKILSKKLLDKYGLRSQASRQNIKLLEVAISINPNNPYAIIKKQRRMDKELVREIIKRKIDAVGKKAKNVRQAVRLYGLPKKWETHKVAKQIIKELIES